MKRLIRSWFVQLFIVLVLLGIGFFIYEVITLNKAHSTLANYSAFRGCTSLSEQKDTSATCHLSNGQTIKLVQINTKWYLDGDGPSAGW